MSTPIDLTGVWTCDDGGIYYVRQLADNSVTWAGLQDSGFHKGMGFANVFRGALSDDGELLIGEWADVPRGESANSGILTAGVMREDDGSLRLLKFSGETSGGFGGKRWTNDGKLLVPQDIADLAGRVLRYDKPLGENNPPLRDFTVMWGRVWEPKPGTLPHVPYDYCSFLGMVETPDGPLPFGGWGGDGDFTFNVDVQWDSIYPNGTNAGDFWNHGWVSKQPDAFSEKPVALIAMLYESHHYFHVETAMYGRENGTLECADPPMNLLPGWNERGGWSVLANGRAIDGRRTVGNPSDPDNLFLNFQAGSRGQEIVEINSGGETIVRVTGVVAFDTGHTNPAPEIHPVYSIDVLQDFPNVRMQPPTLSGAWHGADNGTYYLRQLGQTIWWLGLSRDQGRSFANVFHGTIDNTNGTIEGEWVDLPMGIGGVLSGGTLLFKGDNETDTQLSTTLLRTSESAPFGARMLTKLYDTAGTPVGRHGSEPPVTATTD